MESCPRVYGALNTLAMGDLQAVAIAQTCHLGMAVQHSIFDSSELITGRGPIPRGPDYFGVIDDFVGISAVPAQFDGKTRAASTSDKIEGVYRQVGLHPQEEKAEKGPSSRELLGSSLGRSARLGAWVTSSGYTACASGHEDCKAGLLHGGARASPCWLVHFPVALLPKVLFDHRHALPDQQRPRTQRYCSEVERQVP